MEVDRAEAKQRIAGLTEQIQETRMEHELMQHLTEEKIVKLSEEVEEQHRRRDSALRAMELIAKAHDGNTGTKNDVLDRIHEGMLKQQSFDLRW
jgi:acetyl-CoA carboxylase alpha subunit